MSTASTRHPRRRLPARRVFDALLAAFGPQHWWPAETDTEMMAGAVLVQNTAWTNAARAVAALRETGWLDWRVLAAVPPDALATRIRPAGYARVKTARLQHLARWMVQSFGGRNEELFALSAQRMRAGLLGVHGIGPETADCIVLYAGRRPVFVVDAYTRRILARHGWATGRECYDGVAELFTRQLPADTALFNEYHALLVALGKAHCRAKPDCRTCPLRRWLPRKGA